MENFKEGFGYFVDYCKESAPVLLVGCVITAGFFIGAMI